LFKRGFATLAGSAGAVVLTLGTCVPAVAASAVDEHGVETSSATSASAAQYVALGDSFASGNGAGPYQTPDNGCHRSSGAYPQVWADAHPLATSFLEACSGATTQDVIDKQLTHLSASTTLVSVTIGGNDVVALKGILACMQSPDPAVCHAAAVAGQAAITSVLPARLDAVYAAIRSRAPSARVVVVGYPRLFSLNSCEWDQMWPTDKRTEINHTIDMLGAVILERAAAAGFAYVDPTPSFEGHGICGSSPWINMAGPDDFSWFHPNALGQQSLASLFTLMTGSPVTIQTAIASSQRVLDVESGTTADDARIITYFQTGQSNQSWTLQPQSDGTVLIVSVRSSKCIDGVAGLLVQWTCTGRPSQRWRFNVVALPSGFAFRIVHVLDGQSVDLLDWANYDGAAVGMWDDYGSVDRLNQRWIVSPAS
jgi:lysophospholipase L1-like esterase